MLSGECGGPARSAWRLPFLKEFDKRENARKRGNMVKSAG